MPMMLLPPSNVRSKIRKMERVTVTRYSRFKAQDIFDLVGDVGHYHLFVPYCTHSDILLRAPHSDGEMVRVSLCVAYKFIQEGYISDVVLAREKLEITTHQHEGAFAHLFNRWRFVPCAEGCEIHFQIDYDFRVPLLARIISPLMGRAVDKMIAAFEARAEAVYCTSSETE